MLSLLRTALRSLASTRTIIGDSSWVILDSKTGFQPVSLRFQAHDAKAESILFGIGFLLNSSEHLFRVRAHRCASRRRCLFCQLDHLCGGRGRVKSTALHGVEGG